MKCICKKRRLSYGAIIVQMANVAKVECMTLIAECVLNM